MDRKLQDQKVKFAERRVELECVEEGQSDGQKDDQTVTVKDE